MASMRIGGDYMRLIDADALPRQTQIYEFNGKRMEKEIVSARFIDNAPTIDAVPVVRCKDCKWFNRFGCAVEIVDFTDKPTENDYCSFGERKDNE